MGLGRDGYDLLTWTVSPVSVDVLGLDYESRSGDIGRIDWSMAFLMNYFFSFAAVIYYS